jgi:hypothetical protein
MKSRTQKLMLAGGFVAVLCVTGILFHFDPSRGGIYPVCSFHRLTGLDCPGCGSLRAVHQLLHGHIREALQLNAFLVLSLPLWAWLGLRLAWGGIKDGPAAIRPFWLWLYLAAWVAFGVLRNLPVPGFQTGAS